MSERKTVGIIGYGVVGQAMERMFAPAFHTRVCDPNKAWLYSDDLAAKVSRESPECDLAVICVGTPEGPDRRCDLSQVVAAVRDCKAPLILIKSTVPPGTTDWLINSYEQKKRICFSPEYIGEPTNYVPPQYLDPRRPQTHPFVTVGGYRTDASEILSYFKKVMATSARYNICTAVEAELAKYMENTYFAMKVAFCTEWSEIARMHGVDYNVLRELWLCDPRVDPDHTLVHEDQPGFGGRCLPKDLSAIIEHCIGHKHFPSILMQVRDRNDRWHGRKRDKEIAREGNGQEHVDRAPNFNTYASNGSIEVVEYLGSLDAQAADERAKP